MGEIPAQLAAKLPSHSIRLQTRVRQLLDEQMVLENGERPRAPTLVVATDAQEAARLHGKHVLPETRGTTCVYFAAEQPPFPGADLALNGEGVGLINSLIEQFSPSPLVTQDCGASATPVRNVTNNRASMRPGFCTG